MALIFAIDPGSTTGIAVFNTETRSIDMAEVYEALHDDYDDKIRWLARAVFECFDLYLTPSAIELVCIETFVMRGVGGRQLQKLIGAYISVTPDGVPLRHVYNTTVKKLIGGKGSDNKEQVAEGVARYFKSNKKSYERICKIISKEQWDLTDAFAIGIAGWMEYQNEQ